MASSKVSAVLEKYKSNLVSNKLQQLGISNQILTPFTVAKVNLASKEKMGSAILGRMAGYLMLLLMFIGAMYPAIDTAAGEKERRTLEALLCSPASRMDILIGKIAACTTAAFFTAILSLTGFLLFAGKSASNMPGLSMQFHVSPATVGLVLLCILPVALLGASVMVAICLLARTFKEGQTYTMPFLMIVIFPIVLGTFANLELTPAVAFIPVFNVSLVLKDIFQGSFSVAGFAISILANLMYAGLALLLAVRTIKNESALFRT